jgi:putative heme-binding domain-containing protein
MRKEIVKSILYPSEIIAVPYLNKAVVTTRGRVYCGRISPIVEPGRVAIVQPEGRRIAVPDAEVEESRTIHASDMPEGLLERLSSQEIQDLFAFLRADRQLELALQPTSNPQPPRREASQGKPKAPAESPAVR